MKTLIFIPNLLMMFCVYVGVKCIGISPDTSSQITLYEDGGHPLTLIWSIDNPGNDNFSLHFRFYNGSDYNIGKYTSFTKRFIKEDLSFIKSRIQLERQSNTEYGLEIVNVTKTDAGTYICRYEKNQESAEANISLVFNTTSDNSVPEYPLYGDYTSNEEAIVKSTFLPSTQQQTSDDHSDTNDVMFVVIIGVLVLAVVGIIVIAVVLWRQGTTKSVGIMRTAIAEPRNLDRSTRCNSRNVYDSVHFDYYNFSVRYHQDQRMNTRNSSSRESVSSKCNKFVTAFKKTNMSHDDRADSRPITDLDSDSYSSFDSSFDDLDA